MAVPKKHSTKSKVGKRRSQKTLKRIQAEVCGRCRGPVLSHRQCPNCGHLGKVGSSIPKTRVDKKIEQEQKKEEKSK